MRIDHHRQLVRGMILALVLAGMLAPWGQGWKSALAQDDEQPDTGRIFGWRQEIIFPAVIRFVLGLNAGLDELESVSLTVRQESGLELTFALDPEENLLQQAGIVTQLVYLWDLSGDPSPVPFELVKFTWEVKTTDGEVCAKGRGSGISRRCDDSIALEV